MYVCMYYVKMVTKVFQTVCVNTALIPSKLVSNKRGGFREQNLFIRLQGAKYYRVCNISRFSVGNCAKFI